GSPDGPRVALSGAFSAVAVQNGNGRHTLSQEIRIPDGATSGTLLRWRQELRNHAGIYSNSQRFSVELRDAATEALLTTLYSTTPTNLAFEGPTNRSVSLAAWRGQRVRVVFVEEDVLGDFNVHLDNVSVIATSAAPTTYDVYFGTDAVPDLTEYRGSTTNAQWTLLPLAGGLNYYWRIDSRRLGITNTGPVWHFTTAGSSLSTTPLTFGSAWKYVATGVNLGTAWASSSYNDTIWRTDIAPFGFGSSEVTTIGAASNDVTTFYFRRRLTVFDTNRLAVVTASLKRDDGAIVYINGVEAFRDNMPAGRVDYLTQASAIVSGADETNSVTHPIDPSLFIEGTNIVAVEVHQRDNGFPFPGPSPDLFFDLAFTFRTNAGNLMPLGVNWVLPSDFSTFEVPGNLTVRVGVIDDNLIGAKVEFFGDGAKFAEDFITPFQVTWTNPPVGLRTLLAVVTDPGGLTRTSAPLHVLVVPGGGQSLVTLIPAGAVWRYRQDGEDSGRSWTELSYKEPKDGSWKGGPAQLGYGDGDEATVFDLNLEFGRRPITAYFRHAFKAASTLTSLKLRVVRDDGAAIYLNGTEVFRNNLPAGTLTPGTVALATMNPPNENAWVTVTLPPSVVTSGANVAAAEVHQVTQNSPDLSFDLELTGVGNFLPEIVLTSPVAGSALLSPPSVQLAASASDAYGAVTGVQFFRNGILLGADATAPYEFAWNSPVPGIHALTAVATDNAGATVTSTPVVLTIVPSVALSARALGTNAVELTWPATAPGYRVETCASLEPPIFWVPTTNAVTQANGVFQVLVTPSVEQQYFRLAAP
ncbi:MAG TPA: Ig-like domain-containing protein, partial [Verrucomicrobiae bacterium]|nr:Ig-like domain-containing protein [Verrucomicrobiae bacterium]